MKRVISYALLTIVSSIALTTASHADSLTIDDGPAIEQTLRSFDKAFDVTYLNDYDATQAPSDAKDTPVPRTAEGVHNIQASIASNKSLAEKLQAKGIDLRNVVNAQQAADGSITFFVK